ncbi:MAG TPA: hypothetical protein VJ891_02960 [Casimicrobiaceae bacterium]|nr:hypothetical protein [Casimicrobiaceae bacterium]
MQKLICSNLVRFMDERKAVLNRQDIASLGGVSPASLDAYVRCAGDPDAPDARCPRDSTLERLAIALGRTFDDFFKKHPPPAPALKRPVFQLVVFGHHEGPLFEQYKQQAERMLQALSDDFLKLQLKQRRK